MCAVSLSKGQWPRFWCEENMVFLDLEVLVSTEMPLKSGKYGGKSFIYTSHDIYRYKMECTLNLEVSRGRASATGPEPRWFEPCGDLNFLTFFDCSKEIFCFLKKARNMKDRSFGRYQHTVVKLYSRRLQHDVAMQLISMSS